MFSIQLLFVKTPGIQLETIYTVHISATEQHTSIDYGVMLDWLRSGR